MEVSLEERFILFTITSLNFVFLQKYAKICLPVMSNWSNLFDFFRIQLMQTKLCKWYDCVW